MGWLAFAAIGLLQSGCVSGVLANMAVKAPNLQDKPRVVRDSGYAERFDAVAAQAWRLPVGPPAAVLSLAVVEPGNYQFTQQIVVKNNERGHRWLEPEMNWTVPAREALLPAKGTLLLLHGYRDSKENMMHWALCLAEMGYRCVLIDARGHGRSTGQWIGLGAFESRDLVQVIDDLQRRGLAGERVGVLGVSFGASTALLLAARDSRVAAVVALEPFSAAKTGVIEFAHGVSPRQAARIGPGVFDLALRKAPRLAGFDWADNDVLAAMPRVKAPVLFFHGGKDVWLSPDNSRRLFAAAPPGSSLGIVEEDDHIVLSMRLAGIAPQVREWFDRYLVAPGQPVPGTSAADRTTPEASAR